MDGKEERADARESYTMLMELDAIARSHRTLRRELCISRLLIFCLLITCMVVCGVTYIQQVPGSKNNETVHKEKANETRTEFLTDGQENDIIDAQTPLLASLTLEKNFYSVSANLTWKSYHRCLDDFSLTDSGESLLIPQDGKYRLSLLITYWEQDPQEGQSVLTHFINNYPIGNSKPVTILSVYETVYKTSTWYKSMFSEVIHVFNEGDRVKVRSENASLIDSAGQPSTKNLLTVQLLSRL
ncbi:uncharacterized protein LOC128607337 [Ictalurus furcatus]|uniref:uncharacterized protein LOC128607337 n=1 Tax=Ictalurus furcatus TaxID=66913 RepID=UPI002350E33A|nr:uncharacterized protein LOC128607337 [Ictalurus furcatus]